MVLYFARSLHFIVWKTTFQEFNRQRACTGKVRLCFVYNASKRLAFIRSNRVVSRAEF